MRYILDLDLMKGYEEIVVGMLDNLVKMAYDRGIVTIIKQEKVGEPYYDTLLREHNLENKGK